MAIKERKQITGTTEQINAYEGHEGQIVWDKDKKTFVGMSGTAGKNYPLAQQAYVDTKFLPLTGGNVTGNIVFDTGAILSAGGDFRELLLTSDAKEDPSGNAGAYLALRNSGGANESSRGSFALHTRLADTTVPYILEGRTNGYLTWGGHPIPQITSSGEGWIRFSPNLQICFGYGESTKDNFVTIAYGAPFDHHPFVTTTTGGDHNTSGPYICYVSTNNIFFTAYTFSNGALSSNIGFHWIAIGYY